jgi:hypothetical protein
MPDLWPTDLLDGPEIPVSVTTMLPAKYGNYLAWCTKRHRGGVLPDCYWCEKKQSHHGYWTLLNYWPEAGWITGPYTGRVEFWMCLPGAPNA